MAVVVLQKVAKALSATESCRSCKLEKNSRGREPGNGPMSAGGQQSARKGGTALKNLGTN